MEKDIGLTAIPNHDEKMTFKMFKEEGDYDDAIYYGQRIKILMAEYKEVIEDIENAKKRLPQRWKEELDQKLHEHISSDKKIKKIFHYDDPEHAKGGDIDWGEEDKYEFQIWRIPNNIEIWESLSSILLKERPKQK